MKFAHSLHVAVLSALLPLAAFAGGETLGFWVFNGTPGTEYEGVWTNHIGATALDCYISHTNVEVNLPGSDAFFKTVNTWNQSQKKIDGKIYPNLGVFVSDIPYPSKTGETWLFADGALTTSVAYLSSSLLLKTNSNARTPCVVVPHLGSFLMDEYGNPRDFTIEVIARYDDELINRKFFGITGTNLTATSSAFEFLMSFGDNSATITCADNSGASSQSANFSKKVPGSTWLSLSETALTPTDKAWHNFALLFDAATKTFTVEGDFFTTASVTAAHPQFGPESLFYLNSLGNSTIEGIHEAHIAALRITKGKLSKEERLEVWNARVPGDTVAHWRFDDPVYSDWSVAQPANNVKGWYGKPLMATNSEFYVPHHSVLVGDNASYFCGYQEAVAWKAYVASTIGNQFLPNAGAVTEDRSAVTDNGVNFRIPLSPVLNPASFTFEAIFQNETSLDYSIVMGAPTWSGATCSNPKSVRTAYPAWMVHGSRIDNSKDTDKLTFTCYYSTNAEPEVLVEVKSAPVAVSPGWHHCAVTYDAATKTYKWFLNYVERASIDLRGRENLVAVRPAGVDEVASSYKTLYLGAAEANLGPWSAPKKFTLDEARLLRRAAEPSEFLRAANARATVIAIY